MLIGVFVAIVVVGSVVDVDVDKVAVEGFKAVGLFNLTSVVVGLVV